MKLSEFRELIHKTWKNAVYGDDPEEKKLAENMKEAEYFAYISLKTVITDIKDHIEVTDRFMTDDLNRTQKDRDEAEGAFFMLGDVMEFITDFLEGKDDTEEETTHYIDMTIELDEN